MDKRFPYAPLALPRGTRPFTHRFIHDAPAINTVVSHNTLGEAQAHGSGDVSADPRVARRLHPWHHMQVLPKPGTIHSRSTPKRSNAGPQKLNDGGTQHAPSTFQQPEFPLQPVTQIDISSGTSSRGLGGL